MRMTSEFLEGFFVGDEPDSILDGISNCWTSKAVLFAEHILRDLTIRRWAGQQSRFQTALQREVAAMEAAHEREC